ncbi:ATP-grasp domain-containing protein [Goodfellowiella coeruleoviolacea]|uniref:ATP-grasp domain-containing protein n=1 Tax=Goodfellowiella coeruleoviolacea TaxID=334858 RepID=A0AAE3GJ56_9PSEU|nr:ATP-grasp domain-containing protein [Goodfellowiella coeruleoviolacea]MCP2167098.1 ATP-grasp domain-containing protein [Goodfellowiella coeruleoviolacea]
MTTGGTIVLLEALTFGLGRLVDAATEAGYRLCLLTGDRAIYAHELSRLAPEKLDVIDIDTTDIPACEAALRGLPDLVGLINSTDTWAIPGAELAARLGLPGPDPATVRVLRDKGEVRARLHQHGLSRSTAVPVDVVHELPLPVIIKDSAGTSSRAVWLARTPDEIDTALHEAETTPLTGHLIAEPYFAGPLYSAETITWQGRTRLLGVVSRQLSPEPRRREEAAAFPVTLSATEHADLARWIARVLDTLGHQGFAHTEFIHTTSGPEVVEVNPRIGGALVGEALCRALNTNVYTAMIAAAVGREPELLTQPLRPGPGIAFVLCYPTRPGTLTGWTGLDRLEDFPGTPDWYPTARPGDPIHHIDDQRGCTGIVLAEGATAETALHRALAAAGAITPITEPQEQTPRREPTIDATPA